MTYKKKLIEVALPLEAINRESAREKSIRHGHPSTMHLWWARRPLAACRAVLFASLVDDPSAHPERFLTEDAQETERKRLFGIIEQLVLWENVANAEVLNAAKAEIMASCDGNPPPVLDPFCGGGSIPLEAQRLGLEAYASDLNPVAVLITKALIEFPPRFSGRPPVHPREGMAKGVESWVGAQGLAADIRYYGAWMRDRAEERIGVLYPKVTLPRGQGGGEATVIAWLWARTVVCPNPACGAQMPLVRSFVLSTKKGSEAWVEPIIEGVAVRFEARVGKGRVPDGTVNRRGARCVVCDSPVPFQHVRAEGQAGRMSAQLMAVVAEGDRRRAYLTPTAEQEATAFSASPGWVPDSELPAKALGFRVQAYGMTHHRDLFTDRQLVALETFSDLVVEARDQALADAIVAGVPDDGVRLADGGSGAVAYADAVATYLAFAVDKGANYWSTICAWHTSLQKMMSTFSRQAIPMVWDYAEANPFSSSSGEFLSGVRQAADGIVRTPATGLAKVRQLDAEADQGLRNVVVSTDPPYYDNIGYADLSDYFFVWLRRSLGRVHPDLFATLLTPKAEELVATPHRFGGDRAKADEHFEKGMRGAFVRLREAQHPEFPTTVFYAFKQEEDAPDGTASTGWDTMLTALSRAGFAISGTWPVRTELVGNLKKDIAALASSIVIVCRPRHADAALATRSEFLGALRVELPGALRRLQHGNIAPVDLAQASIGPGMGVFSRYSRVVEADGKDMPVRTALALINQVLDEILAAQEGDFDPETRWAVAWFEQNGLNPAAFGDADVLARAKDTAVGSLVGSGILESRSGKVRLLDRNELPDDWNPATDTRLTVWEVTQNLVKAALRSELEAGELARKVGGLAEVARELAYRLFVVCERKGWAQEALAYNALVVAWPEITRLAAAAGNAGTSEQGRLEV